MVTVELLPVIVLSYSFLILATPVVVPVGRVTVLDTVEVVTSPSGSLSFTFILISKSFCALITIFSSSISTLEPSGNALIWSIDV